MKGAYDLVIEVLQQLGEEIPTSFDPKSFVDKVDEIQSKLSSMTEDDIMSMKRIESPSHYSLMKFHNQASFIAVFANPPMLTWFITRLVELALEHGLCKYSALGIVSYSVVLGGKLIKDLEGGYRLGKIALKLLERFEAQDLLSNAYLTYYGYIAVHKEPFVKPSL